MSRVKDETGKRYGKLVVLERNGSINGKAAWLCQCDCGKQTTVTGDALRQGYSTTCGDIKHQQERMRKIGQTNFIDITGQTFNNLTAIEPIGSSSYGGVLWKCQCRCGNYHTVEYSNLKNGHVKSCGCLVSFGESEIQRILTVLHIDFKTQYTPVNWRLSSGNKPFYDIAIFHNEQLKCLIEYHGAQHRKPVDFFGGMKEFENIQRRDREKEKLCLDNNISLYTIWYNENIKQSLLKILTKENLISNNDFDII